MTEYNLVYTQGERGDEHPADVKARVWKDAGVDAE